MKQVYLSERREEEAFAIEAAEFFAENPRYTSYSSEELESGCYLALRWGLGQDCVLVVKLAENFEPQNYCNIIAKR